MTDPLLNEINFTIDGIGVANVEIEGVKNYLIIDIQKTIAQPACINESVTKHDTRYYFQYFKSTVFMCIVKKNEAGWY